MEFTDMMLYHVHHNLTDEPTRDSSIGDTHISFHSEFYETPVHKHGQTRITNISRNYEKVDSHGNLERKEGNTLSNNNPLPTSSQPTALYWFLDSTILNYLYGQL